MAALHDAFAKAEEHPDVQCVVLSSAGGAFCSGIDLKESAPGRDMRAAMVARHRLIAQMTTPTVAGVERYAINAGSGLALACDILVIGRESFLQISEAAMGDPRTGECRMADDEVQAGDGAADDAQRRAVRRRGPANGGWTTYSARNGSESDRRTAPHAPSSIGPGGSLMG